MSTAGFNDAGPRVRGSLHDGVRAQRADGAARRASRAWEGDKLTVYTPTGGIANCRHDIARDLGIPDDKVRVVCQYMGGNFGNKNQNQDADLIAAMLAKEAGAPGEAGVHAQGRLHRRARPLADDAALQGRRQGRRHATAIQLRGSAAWGRTARTPAASPASSSIKCANVETCRSARSYTNRTVSGNFRGPAYPQGFFGIQSMMDDVAYELKMDPVDFMLKNMTRMSRDEVPYTNYTLEECIRRGAEVFDWKAPVAPQPGVGRGADQAWRRHDVHGCSARGSDAAARSSQARMRAATTRCSSASPTSAPARRRRWT